MMLSRMDTAKLNLLAARIERLIERFCVLKKQKSELEERVLDLGNELRKRETGQTESLKRENKALRKAQVEARSKVEGLVQRLDAMDLE